MAQNNDLFYVAPVEGPPSRKPPIRERGIFAWMRKNLFASVPDTLATLLTIVAVGGFLWVFGTWALLQAQWEVVFNNLRQLMLGNLYPVEQASRPEYAALVLVFLSLMSVGLWGRIGRTVIGVIAVIAAAMLIVPPLSRLVPHPPVHVYIDESYPARQINFLAEQGQTLTFTIDPLTASSRSTDAEGTPLASDFELRLLNGYIENDNQTPNTSFDAFNTRTQSVRRWELESAGQAIPPAMAQTLPIDPTQYNLSLSVQVWDRDGNVVAESEPTNGITDSDSFAWTAPETGWYTFTMERLGGSVGAAWLVVDNVDVFRSTRGAQAERLTLYGAEPTLTCAGCATATNRTDMRFQGERTLAQWFSLQLAPFLLETREFFFMSVFLGTVGYLIGAAAQRGSGITANRSEWVALGVVTLAVLFGWLLLPSIFGAFGLPVVVGVLIVGAIIYGLQHLSFDGWTHAESTLRTVVFVAVGVYALVLLGLAFFPNPTISLIGVSVISLLMALYGITTLISRRNTGTGMTLLWVVGAVVMFILVLGATNVAGLPPVDGQDLGGLLLTLMLSVVAIIASIPLGVLLALGRQSDLPVIRLICTIFIEVVRGVPLITLLFMGWLILPFFGLGLQDVDLIVRVMVVLTLFTSAYMAEVVRGGLQVVAKGQIEAAHAVGLNDFYTTSLIVLPQALRAVIPAIMGQAVSLFKDTSLIYVISLFELLGSMNQILGDSQTGYLAFPREGYIFVGALYFVISYIMAEISRRVERTGAGAVRRDTL